MLAVCMQLFWLDLRLGVCSDSMIDISSSDGESSSHVEVVGDDGEDRHGGGELLAGDDLERVMQLGLAHQPAARPQFKQRDRALLAYARQRQQENKHERERQRHQQELGAATSALDAVARSFPAVLDACQVSRRGLARSSGEDDMPPEKAKALLNAVFNPEGPKRGLGVRPERLAMFVADLYLDLQARGLAALLLKCMHFRAQSSGGCINRVVFKYTHESDATQQAIAQRAVQRIGRAAAKRLSTDVFNQRGYIQVYLCVVEEETDTIRDAAWVTAEWVCPSAALLGKSAPFVAKALQLGLPFCFGDHETLTKWTSLLRRSTDRVIFEQVGDKGSNNLPAFRSVAGSLLGTSVRDTTLVDVGCCELHVVQSIKNSVADLKDNVGRMYGLSRVSAVASFHNNLVHVIEALCHMTIVRVVAPRPSHLPDLRLLLEKLYGPSMMSSTGHKRQSALRTDLQALAEIQVFASESGAAITGLGGSGPCRIHYCWNEKKRAACCSSVEESREKACIALVNYHCSQAFETVSMSRFTHVSKARRRLIVGMACDRLYLTAVRTAATRGLGAGQAELEVAIPTIECRAEEAGAGSEDFVQAHRARCLRLSGWLQSRAFYFTMAIAESAERPVDALQTAFFGEDKKSISLAALLDASASPISACAHELLGMLESWTMDQDGAWAVLSLSGWTDFEDKEVRMCARRHVLCIGSGVFLRYEVKFSGWPWRLQHLLSEDVSEGERAAICAALVGARPCCLPTFAQDFRRMFSTVAAMQSAEATAVLRAWSKNKLLTTKASELGHATERRMLAAAAAPGRSFVHHSRKDVLQKARVAHVRNNGKDPAVKPSLKSRRPEAPAELEDPLWQLLDKTALGQIDDVCTEFATPVAAVLDSERPLPLDGPSSAGADAASGRSSHLALQDHSAADARPAKVRRQAASSSVGDAQARPASATAPCGSGGSVYLTFLNHSRQTFKLSLGGSRKVTQEEMRQIEASAKEEWAEMPPEAKAAFAAKHRQAVLRRKGILPAEEDEAERPAAKYIANLGIGTPEDVISPKLFASAPRPV